MKVATIGPIVKDVVMIDSVAHTQIGGIPYYQGMALFNLGVETTVFGSYAPADDSWIRSSMSGVNLINIPAKETIVHKLTIESNNPDHREVEVVYFTNTIQATEELVSQLEAFDIIIFGPLYWDDISPDLYKKLSHKKLIFGNFGAFSYAVNNKLVWKNPENIMEILPYISFLFLDEKEILFAMQTESVQEAVAAIQSVKQIGVIVTMGSKGSRIFYKQKTINIPAFPPSKLVDPTGAGDTYVAGFIKSLVESDDLERAGKFAAACATIKLKNRGAFKGSLNDVLQIIK